ncbi:hypothetical protein DIPPA_19631 [Diplonema papillatum]|nr:hypothetical protein DIPPA_19631 [Diplonema papillatum]
MKQLATVEHLHLNVEENSSIAAHLGVQSTPCVLLIHDAEVVDVIGCAADDLLADHAVQQLARGSSKVFDNLVYKTTAKAHGLALGRKYLQQKHWGEARWSFQSVLRSVQAGEFTGTQLPGIDHAGDGMTMEEVVTAKACAGLILVAASREEHETASALILTAEMMLPRALGYLSDVRRSLCIADILLLNRCNRHPAIREACLRFLQGEYLQAFCGLKLVLDDMPFFNDGPPAPEMLLPLLRFATYLTPSHDIVNDFLEKNPDMTSTLDVLVEPPCPPCEPFDLSHLDVFLDAC